KNYPHHVIQRGNYQQPVFESEDDFIQYKLWFKEYSQRYDLSIWAYCLMTNHIHIVCVPHKEDSLARTFNTLHMRYSHYFNRKKGAKGHLWQGRFFSCILDERHLYSAIRYIENNPVRVTIVEKAYEYRWSSARGHIERGTDPLLSKDCYLEKEIRDWQVYLDERDDEQLVRDIRKSSMTGRPCGDVKFIQSIEGLLGRRLLALPWGRPPKSK
ncbi:MAG: transposase, partial [Thermodesulfobacteriota bacterium]|nr:transposase [Thermodesulfobacteriota bacterium]